MKNLYVGNLPHSTTEAELRGVFEAHGAVEKVSIVTDRETGRARGFAFVEMTNPAEADKAVAALNGTELGGRALKINEAKPKTDAPRGGGGGKRFGGGGGGSRDDYQGHARQPRNRAGRTHNQQHEGRRLRQELLHLNEMHLAATAICKKLTTGRRVCQDEVDQALPNARKNTRASKNNAIKPSAGFNAKPTSL